MAKTAIAIDDWKLDIFDKALTDAGYTYVKNPGVTRDTLLLSVETDNIPRLAQVVKMANEKAAIEKTRMGG